MTVNQPMPSPHMTDYQQHQMHVPYQMSAPPQSAPQPSPIGQMGTPHHPPPQYVHPGTPVYGNDPFQGVMSPMQQSGMQPPSGVKKSKSCLSINLR